MANEKVNVTKEWLLDFYNSKIKPYLNGASGAIDDSSTASNKTWSASKINTQLGNKLNTSKVTDGSLSPVVSTLDTIAITLGTDEIFIYNDPNNKALTFRVPNGSGYSYWSFRGDGIYAGNTKKISY